MKRVNLDHRAAEAVLRKAATRAKAQGFAPSSRHAKQLRAVITGSHLTYRYILVTGLLAKATDSSVHPLSLQAGANLDGAYDARSLCHSVIVPNEAALLLNGLGGSNEPYLNKPARFTHVDLRNPVRNGNDRRTLQVLHGILSSISTSADANAALQDAIYFAIQRIAEEKRELESVIHATKGGLHQISRYLRKLVARSHHGESSVLATAGVFWLMALSKGEKWTISVHPVNESGSSSNQVSDIDVRFGRELLITAEVKDKTFTAQDVAHAVSRVRREPHHSLHFIVGPLGELEGATPEAVETAAAEAGVELHLVRLVDLIAAVVPFAPRETEMKDFAAVIASFAKEARVKAETIAHLRDVTASL